MNIFIDTNIYLKFYHLSNIELEELKKLVVLVEEGEINLIIPRQVLNEFTRNRETKIADALRQFKEEKLNNLFPLFFKEYEEYENMRKAINEFNKNKKNLLEKINTEIEKHSLLADQIMDQLIVKAGILECDDAIIVRAKQRFDLGNPPGKKGSYGDAVNWLTLLNNVNVSEDLYFLSDDKDYFSEIDNSKFNNFLSKEWRTLKVSKIHFFKSLSEFFREKFPQIKLASDYQKDIYIERLKSSATFRDSRYNLQRICEFDDFNSEQLNTIVEATLENYQILWISEDFDINKMLYHLTDNFGKNMNESLKKIFEEKIPRILSEN